MAKETKSSARKTSQTPTKIMTFGARVTSDEQRKIINDIVFQSYLYKRQLIEIEIKRREAFRALRRRLSPTLNALEEKADQLEAQILELRGGLKKKKDRTEPDQVELINKINTLIAEKKEVYPQIKKEKLAVNKKFFVKGDQIKKDLYSKEEEKVLKKLGKEKFGPNDNAKKELRERLYNNLQKRKAKDLQGWIEKEKIEWESHKETLKARAETKCPPGVYLAVEEAVNRAKKDAKTDPRHKPFNGRGKVGIQITTNKGLSVSEALSTKNSKFKIDVLDDAFIRGMQRANRRGEYRKAARVSMRLQGRDKDASWLDLDVVLHRELPADGIIKWAYIYVDKVGYTTTYELQLTIEAKTFIQEKPKGSGHVAINFGWRVQDDGSIKVATLWDGSESSVVVLPKKQSTKTLKGGLNDSRTLAPKLLGYSDDHFDTTLRVFTDWLGQKDCPLKANDLQEAMPGHLKGKVNSIPKIRQAMGQWKAHKKLVRVSNVLSERYLTRDQVQDLWALWCKERNVSSTKKKKAVWKKSKMSERGKDKKGSYTEQDLFAPFTELDKWFKSKGVKEDVVRMTLFLEWWRRKEFHLVCWARNVERKAMLWRREIYRREAVRLFRRYEHVVIEKWDKSKTAKKPSPENDKRTQIEENSNAVRQFAGISVFTAALKELFRDNLKEEKSKDISVNHYGCGGVAKTSVTTTSQMNLCPKCKKLFDQDLNAAQHLWDSLGDRKKRGGARSHSKKAQIAAE